MSFRTKGQDDMEIKNICTFVKAAELGNFTKAAQELGYAQSTVTAQIQQLENELHVNLFEMEWKTYCPFRLPEKNSFSMLIK